MFELWLCDWCRKYARRAAVKFIALEDMASTTVKSMPTIRVLSPGGCVEADVELRAWHSCGISAVPDTCYGLWR